MPLKLRIGSFGDGDFISRKYTCDGDDISPGISWSGYSGGTISFALIMDDPDAPSGTFVHWVLYNLNHRISEIPENFPKLPETQEGIFQGRNDFGKVGYGGPCPPGTKPHRYVFHLYATTADPAIPAGMNKKRLLLAIHDKILEEVQVTLMYARQR